MRRAATMRMAAGMLAAVALLAGCGGGSGGSAEKAPETIKVGVFGPDVTFGAFFASTAPGASLDQVATKAGSRIEVQTIPSGSNLVAALTGGSVDLAILPGSSVLGVHAQGGEVVPLVNMFDGPSQQIIAPARLQATHGEDIGAFAGQRWAFTRVGSIGEATARLTAESAGLIWDAQQRLPLGSGSETEAVLQSDRADILSTSPANAGSALQDRSAYLVRNPQDDEQFPLAHQLNAILSASPSFAEEHPQLTQDIVTSVVSSLQDVAAASSAEQALDLMPVSFREAAGPTWTSQWDLSRSGFARATGGFTKKEIDATVLAAQMAGITGLDGAAPADLFSNSYVSRAFETLQRAAPAGLA